MHQINIEKIYDDCNQFLGAFAKIFKSFAVSARPSVCPHGPTQLSLDGFSENLIFEYFRKSAAKIQDSLNRTKITGTLYFDPSTIMIIPRSIPLRNISEKKIKKI